MDGAGWGSLAVGCAAGALAIDWKALSGWRRARVLRALAQDSGFAVLRRAAELEGPSLARLPLFEAGFEGPRGCVLHKSAAHGDLYVFDYRRTFGTSRAAERQGDVPRLRDATCAALFVRERDVAPFALRNGELEEGFVDPRAVAALASARGSIRAEAGGPWILVSRVDGGVPSAELGDFVNAARSFTSEVAAQPDTWELRAAG